MDFQVLSDEIYTWIDKHAAKIQNISQPNQIMIRVAEMFLVVKILSSPLFKKALSFVTFSLIVVFIFGLINIEHSSLGISEPLFTITKEIIIIFDIIFWLIVSLLTLELVIAYLKIRNAKSFVKKYWLEIIMLILMPIFVGFKILKVSLKIIKQIKIGKTVFKLFQKIKKT
ncbi:hypothetical protein YTPLAS73_00730 [Nitrosarchaeum sp.]|nr:hypothetical protein YTPLAS73_00730 [Nitrosarchaeum sp.]